MAMFHTKVKLYLEANSKTWEDEFKKGDTYHIIFNDDEIAAILSFDSIRSIINEKLNNKI